MMQSPALMRFAWLISDVLVVRDWARSYCDAWELVMSSVGVDTGAVCDAGASMGSTCLSLHQHIYLQLYYSHFTIVESVVSD